MKDYRWWGEKYMNNIDQKISMADQRNDEQEYHNAMQSAINYLAIPEEYKLTNIMSHKHNSTDVWVFRYEKASGENSGLGGEHYSLVIEKDTHKILGFTWMDQKFTSGDLPSNNRTKDLAKAFLEKIELGLFHNLQNLWIRPHDEFITVNHGNKNKQLKITGMKYKCYLKEEDSYVWVIIGPNEQIITFEREIKWEGQRITEKWLHDSWILDKN